MWPVLRKGLHIVPTIWNTSGTMPVPKKHCPKENNDFRPIALTSIVIKTLEPIVVNKLNTQTVTLMDPFQFAYRAQRST